VSPRLVDPTEVWRPSVRRRVLRRLAASKWLLTALLWVIALGLGYWGFHRYFTALGEAHTVSGTFYRSLQLVVLESGGFVDPLAWQLEVARYLAPLVAAFTAIIAALVLLGEQFASLRLRFFANHVVICGLGRKGMLIAGQLHADGHDVVAVDSCAESAHRETCQNLSIPVVTGDAREIRTLRRAQVASARSVIAVCGEDGTNVQIAVSAARLARDPRRNGRPLDCTVHLVDVHLWRLLRHLELRAGVGEPLRLEFFNVFDSGARRLLQEYLQSEQHSAPPGNLLIVGLGHMGESIVGNAAYLWRTRGSPSLSRPKIVVVDRAAQERCDGLLDRQPRLDEVCDLVPIEMDVTSSAFERGRCLFEKGQEPIALACICLDDDARALCAAIALQRHTRPRGIPLWVRVTRELGLAALVLKDGAEAAAVEGEFVNLHTFNLLEETCKPDLVLYGTRERLARILHEGYRRDHTIEGQPAPDAPWAVPWQELPEEIRESNRAQSDHVRLELATAGYEIGPVEDWGATPTPFTEEEVETLARLEHERWLAERHAAGWTYAPGDPDKKHKTNPRLLDWDSLSEPDREASRRMTRRLPELLEEVGLQVRPRLEGASAADTSISSNPGG